MGNERFDFKQFSVQQDRCAMKVGTDGVLLGAWFSLRPLHDDGSTAETKHILDIGTGTGLMALMAAQRAYTYNILYNVDAIEIDKDATEQAKENVSASPYHGNISIIHVSMQEFAATQVADLHYDIIISNPPFYNATLKPEEEARAVARHKDSLPLKDITDFAQTHLSKSGELSLIYPTDYDNEVMTAAILSGLHTIRICDVVTKKGKPCKRRMATFALGSHPQKELLREILYIREEDGNYSDAYKQLTSPFYLHLKDS